MAIDDQYTVALMHFDGSIIDETGKIWAANGGIVVSTAQSKFGGSSLYIDANTKNITTPYSSDFSFGTGDFTIDFWIYFEAYYQYTIPIFSSTNASTMSDGWALYCYSGKTTFYSTANRGDFNKQIPTAAITHVAIIRKNGVLYLALNGDMGTGIPFNYNITTTTGTTIHKGDSAGGGGQVKYYIDELRISKGIARWTANFTPPTQPYGKSLQGQVI